MNFFNSINLILILINVLFFIIVQTLLFHFLISKKVEETVIKDYISFIKKKINVISLLQNIPSIKVLNINSLQKNNINTNDIKKKIKDKDKRNFQLLKKKIGPLVIILLILILLLLIFGKYKKNKWESYHYKLLFLIVGGFLTEYIYYLFVVKKYSYIDHDNMVLNTIKNNLVYNPICYYLPKYENKTKDEIRNSHIKLVRDIWKRQTKKDISDYYYRGKGGFGEQRFKDKENYLWEAYNDLLIDLNYYTTDYLIRKKEI